jgi:citronellol/citronellal dehydrogenase
MFANKTIFITGASRGIGKAMALKFAKEGANIVIAAKSVEEDPRLGGTIFSAAKEVEEAGGQALAVQVNIQQEDQIAAAVAKTVERFGGIDVLINNASAIQLTPTEKTEAKRFDLMHSINVRGTFLMTQHCIPHLKKASNPHILTLSPPVNLAPKWLGGHVAYTISKYNMSMLALGWAEELKQYGIAANALWPKTTIDTAAVRNLLGGQALANMSRTVDIIADAAYAIISKSSRVCTGNTFIDEDVLRAEGVTDLEKYSVVPGAQLYPDLFV